MQQAPQLAKNASCAGALDGHDEHPFVRRSGEAPAGSSMIGLVLVTHGRLAVEFRAALEHVVGPQSQIEAVPTCPPRIPHHRPTFITQSAPRPPPLTSP